MFSGPHARPIRLRTSNSPTVNVVRGFGLAVAAVALLAGGCGTKDSKTSATTSASTSTTSSAPSTTSHGAGTTTTVATPTGNVVVWPPAGATTSYSDPVVAATEFATKLAGFTNPIVGSFKQGDSRSGEVEVRSTATGPITTVFVRQVGTDSAWSVIGSATPNILVTSPTALQVVSSPVKLAGTSTAFEATVNVTVHDRSGGAALGEGIVMGGSMGTMAPFSSTLAFTKPATTEGSIVFVTKSAKDGTVSEAGVVGVRFG